ncbi:MAG: YckD family protein [Chloroflexi bacterium]|nr:YckD family protein [Chloroflexota bacterium]
MKKRWFMVLMVVGLLALLAVPAAVLAQSDEATVGYYPAYRGLWDVSAQERVAQLLGITPAELLTQLEGGATLSELAAAKGVPTESLVATILAPHKEMLDIKVKYGRLTPEQAQQALETVTARVQALVQTRFTATSTWGPGTGPYCPMMGGGYQGDPNATPGLNAPGRGRGWGRGGGMMGRGMMGGWDW